jgi:glycosyltransferase involved in cell wall biosynthesis
MLNGSDLYKKQANDLNIKNIIFLPYAETQDDIYDFVSTLDIFSHGRKDGEVNSAAIAEAMYFGLPIVSHSSPYANGHIECIGEGGRVLDNTEDYATELKKLMENKEYYKFRSSEAKKRFSEMYELENQIAKIVDIYKDVIQNPFPDKLRRLYFDLVNRIKKMLYNRYTLLIYRKLKKVIKEVK